jgi:hypothetical protein
MGKTINSNLTSSSDYKSYLLFTSTPYSTGTIYLSFLFKAGIAQSQANSEIMSLTEGSSSGPKILVGKGIVTVTNYRFATSRGSSSSTDYKWGTTEFSDINQVILLVVKYDFSTQTSSLFVNPTIGTTSEPTPEIIDNTSATIRATLNGIRFRTQGSSAARFNVGGVRVSTTWTAAVAIPAIPLDIPVINAATNVNNSGFTASWTAVANAKGYDVLVYQGPTLVNTTNATGQATESIAVTGLSSNTSYTYKVVAKGDGVIFKTSDPSVVSSEFTTLGLPSPIVGVANAITSSGFTANWSTVTNAMGYDVYVYLLTDLVSTTNVIGQTTASASITGLTMGTSYTYKVIAVGDGTTNQNSTLSASSPEVITTALAVDNINTNFGDGTWGHVYPQPISNLPSVYSFYAVNGYYISDGVIYGSTQTGPKGEIHTNVIRIKNNVSAKLELPTVNSLKQIEIHTSGSAPALGIPKTFYLREYNIGTLSWEILPVGTYNQTAADTIYIINIDRSSAPSKFRIENNSTSSLNISQIITRTTTPSTLVAPTIGAATAISGSGFTANWTPNDANSTGYKIFVYATVGTTTSLRNTFTVDGQSTTNFAVTGIDTAKICTYKVSAIGDGGNLYLDSYLSNASASFPVARLATPVVGIATAIASSGFTANWTPVANASSYDILVYEGAVLKSTTNVIGQTSQSFAITGLPTNVVYTYTIIAKGDGVTNFDSKESPVSASILVIPLVSLPTVTSIVTDGATLGGSIEAGATILERGTVWGTATNPSTNALAEGGTIDGVFTQTRSGMTPNTFYYFRAYSTYSAGTGFSPDATFTTLSLAPVATSATNIVKDGFTCNARY